MPPGENSEQTEGQSGIVRAALSGLCPQCGAPTLFEAPARIALRCDACGLDLGQLERGGRFGGVLTALVAILLILLSVGLDEVFSPPIWLQAAIFAPLTVFSVIGALRMFKTVMVYATYEGRIDETE